MKADVVSKYCQGDKLEYREVDPKISATAHWVFYQFFAVKPIQYTQFRPFEMYYVVIGLVIDAPPV
jgi:hypothetical protein